LSVFADREILKPPSQDLFGIACEEDLRPERGLPVVQQNLSSEGRLSAVLPNDGIPCLDRVLAELASDERLVLGTET
jgi:hypothetical protein